MLTINQDAPTAVLSANFRVTSPNHSGANCDLTSVPTINCTFDGSSSTAPLGSTITAYNFQIQGNNGGPVTFGTQQTLQAPVSLSCTNVLTKIIKAGSVRASSTLLATITLIVTSNTGQTATSSAQSVTLIFGATLPCGL